MSHPEPHLGIAITTFNRCAQVLEQVTAIRAMTGGTYELVICDDGSSDGTAEALRQRGERVIGGVNRGIAWNKNRGIYYLLHVARCDVILLLDDDVTPVAASWERDWVAAAWRYGHVNLMHPAHRDTLAGGGLTADSPGLASVISGWAYAFSRFALAEIGYLDLRFGRYGHEHSDFSFRAVRAGHGGITVGPEGRDVTLFYVIEGGLRAVPSVSAGTQEELETNARLLTKLGGEPIHRHAWQTDEQMRLFLQEIEAATPPGLKPLARHPNRFASSGQYFSQAAGAPPAPTHPGLISRHKPATQSSHSSWSFAPTLEQDAAGAVNGVLDGSRKFHTDFEDNPWWQVDLGGIATITEIHIHNTTDATSIRFGDFALSVSIDGESWVALVEKRDGMPVAAPYIWAGPGTAWARFVRVTLLGRDYLHLSQVEVFGRLP